MSFDPFDPFGFGAFATVASFDPLVTAVRYLSWQ
jgi:hypothetical protein